MTWSLARNKIIEIVESVTGLRTDRGLPSTFKYDPASWDEAPGQERTFNVTATGHGTNANDPAGARRRFRDVDITIYYPEIGGDQGLLDEVVGTDYEAISDALLLTANWDRPNSTIIAIGDGSDEILPADSPVNTATGGRILTVSFPLEHA